MTLGAFFSKNKKVALAFSGGVDSAYLLYAAIHAGANVTAYFVKTPFQPTFELEDARRLAKELGAPLTILDVDILSDATVTENPKNRCYFCKKRIFSAILEQAAKDGYTLVMDGTNASDDASDRPGMQALTELQVRSPLRECGLTKAEIRRLSKEAGLFVCDKPAYACLATRIPTGMPITRELLSKVERSEAFLAGLGFSDFRVRILENGAKLELRKEQLALLLTHRKTILNELKKDFATVLLDLEVRQ